MKTLYDLLEVSSHAPLSDIEHGYRHRLNEYIVRNGNNRPLPKKAQAHLRRLREAYLLLSSPSRRQAYDQHLKEVQQARERMADIGSIVCGALLLAAGLLLIGLSAYQRLQQSDARPMQKNSVAAPAQELAGAQQAHLQTSSSRHEPRRQ